MDHMLGKRRGHGHKTHGIASTRQPCTLRSAGALSVLLVLLMCTAPAAGLLRGRGRATMPMRALGLRRYFVDSQTLIDAATTTTTMSNPLMSPDLVQQTTEVATNTFLNTLVSRTVGALAGNLVAGFLFKWVADQVFAGAARQVKAAVTPATQPADISASAWVKLLFCIMVDLVGDSSFFLPGVGELEDVGWAPISAFLLAQFFGSNTVAGLEFAKEILPGTDILPLATIAWLLENVFVNSPLTGALGLKKQTKEASGEEGSSNNNRT